MGQADTADYEGVPFRVVRPDHLAVIALSVGRPKDFARVLALLESGSVTSEQIAALASRHGVNAAWEQFRRRFASEQHSRSNEASGGVAKAKKPALLAGEDPCAGQTTLHRRDGTAAEGSGL